MFLYADVQQIIFSKPFGEKPAPNLVLIIATIFTSVIFYIFITARLETKINNVGVYVRWSPFQHTYSIYKWSDINTTTIIQYKFIGYGLRLTSYGQVYTAGGKYGLRLKIKDGKCITIGTQKLDMLTKSFKDNGIHISTEIHA